MLHTDLISADDVFPRFSEMRIKHPLHEAAVSTFEVLRKRKVSAPRAEQTAASLFAGSRSGKTTTVVWYIETVIVDEWLKLHPEAQHLSRPILAQLQTLALHVELSGGTTMMTLMTDFLEALGDPDPHKGNVRYKRSRVEKILCANNYQIIFLDESQHIRMQSHAGPISRKDDATEVQNTLKRWVKRWPIVFVGTQHAENIVFEHQVKTRSHTPIKFGPLHCSNELEFDVFRRFCGRLSWKIAKHGVLPNRQVILVSGDVPQCLNIATKGRLGLVTVIVRMAIEFAISNGESDIRTEHLGKAVQDFALRIGMCPYNPFIEGVGVIPSVEDYARDD